MSSKKAFDAISAGLREAISHARGWRLRGKINRVQVEVRVLEGVERGERAFAEGRVISHDDAKRRLKRRRR
jgi:hypothetical protein